MLNIHNAIFALNPSIVIIRGDVAYDKDEQIIEYDMAEAEDKLIEMQSEEAVKEQAVKDAKNSALTKLSALGLTEDEIKSLIG